MSISSTELPLLLYVRSVVGVGRISNKRRSRDHHSPSFAYTLFSRQALSLLERTSGYLRTYKFERARLLLDEYLSVTPRNGRYTPQQRRARKEFEDRFFAISVRARANREFSAGTANAGDGVDFDVNPRGPGGRAQGERTPVSKRDRFESARGQAQVKWRTEELMALLRGAD